VTQDTNTSLAQDEQSLRNPVEWMVGWMVVTEDGDVMIE